VLKKETALILTLLYIIVLTVLSFISLGSSSVMSIDYGDKVFHFGAHAVLASLLYFTFYKWNYRQALVFAAFGSLIFGIIIEVLQGTLTINRQFDVFDIIANCLGMLIAVVIIRGCNKTIVKYL
jgi:glycopeptide antibiotics resistance protein